MHPHANRVVIPMSVQHSRATTSDGKVSERQRKPGQVFWADADVHMTENVSDIPIETIIAEIKKKQGLKTVTRRSPDSASVNGADDVGSGQRSTTSHAKVRVTPCRRPRCSPARK